MYKQNLALNNLQCLVSHKTKLKRTIQKMLLISINNDIKKILLEKKYFTNVYILTGIQ